MRIKTPCGCGEMGREGEMYLRGRSRHLDDIITNTCLFQLSSCSSWWRGHNPELVPVQNKGWWRNELNLIRSTTTWLILSFNGQWTCRMYPKQTGRLLRLLVWRALQGNWRNVSFLGVCHPLEESCGRINNIEGLDRCSAWWLLC